MNETYIEQACASFRQLLCEQIARQERMEKGEKATDFTSKPVITIGVAGGDGIGPIIMEQARRVMAELLKDEIAAGSIVLKEIDGLTIERRMAEGKAIPDDVLAEIKTCDVLLKGPTTTP